MLALYSRCLYLAYIGCMIPNPNNANNANLLWWESNQNVPWMSGAMYFTDHTNVLRVLLSSTYLPGRENWAPAAATTRAKMEMMNQWRKAHVLNPALQFYQPHRVMPPPQHPVAPIVKESLGEGIYRILLSLDLNLAGAALTQLPNHIPALPVNNTWQTVPAGLVDTIWESARAILAAAWIQANPTQPIAALPRDRVWDTAPLGDQLRIALRPVVNVRFAPGYNPINHAANIDNAFRPVFDLLFCPRMFHALPPNPTDPLAPLAPNLIQGEQTSLILGVQAQKDSIWETLYIPHRTAILEMLDRYHHWVTNDDAALAVPSQSLQRYGRCCETYSIAALLWVTSLPPPLYPHSTHKVSHTCFPSLTRQIQTKLHPQPQTPRRRRQPATPQQPPCLYRPRLRLPDPPVQRRSHQRRALSRWWEQLHSGAARAVAHESGAQGDFPQAVSELQGAAAVL